MGGKLVDAGVSGCGEGGWWAGKRWAMLACGVAVAACLVAAIVVPVILSGCVPPPDTCTLCGRCLRCILPSLPSNIPALARLQHVQSSAGGNSCRRGRAEGGGGFGSDTRVGAGCNTSYYSGVRVRLPSLSSCLQPFIQPRTKECPSTTEALPSRVGPTQPNTKKQESTKAMCAPTKAWRGWIRSLHPQPLPPQRWTREICF